MIPGVDRGTRSTIYRRIVEQLQTDPTLLSVFADRWDVGYPQKNFTPPGELGIEPIIRLIPRMSSQQWYSPASHSGQLVIEFNFWLPENRDGVGDVLDVMDCWEAIEDVLYHPDRVKRQVFRQVLMALGATTGEFLITQPAATYPGDPGTLANVGSISLEIKRNLNRSPQ